jgi:hypothetical protein
MGATLNQNLGKGGGGGSSSFPLVATVLDCAAVARRDAVSKCHDLDGVHRVTRSTACARQV